jgi:hypothetical protein
MRLVTIRGVSEQDAAIRAELDAVKAELAAIQANQANQAAPALPEPLILSHEERVAILKRAIVEIGRTQGWKEWLAGGWPEPYATSLRKGGIFTREFITIWVEEDGTVMTQYVGGVGPPQVFVFFGT